jgi:hypothetical protein
MVATIRGRCESHVRMLGAAVAVDERAGLDEEGEP